MKNFLFSEKRKSFMLLKEKRDGVLEKGTRFGTRLIKQRL